MLLLVMMLYSATAFAFSSHHRPLSALTSLALEPSSFEEPFGSDELPYQQFDPCSIQSFNIDLLHIAADNPQRAQDALEVTRDMHQLNPDSTLAPDISSYKIVVDGWIQANKLDQAHAVLIDMEDSAVIPNSTFVTRENVYVSMIQAWADDGKHDLLGTSAQKAEDLLRRAHERLPPNVKLWTVVLEGWCKRAGVCAMALERAESILTEMENIYEVDKSSVLRPNVLTYTSFIGGLARSRDQEKAIKAEEILKRMEKYEVKPDVVAYTCVINCWAKATSRRERQVAAIRSVRLLDEMEYLYTSQNLYNVKPSVITYNAVISAIGNSHDANAPELAEGILERMHHVSKTGVIANMKPTTTTYNAVLHALSRAPRPQRATCAKRAEEILSDMLKRSKDGDASVSPNARTWAAVLRAWSQSGLPNAAEETQRVLNKMEDLHRICDGILPNYVCYTTAMGAWGQSRSEGSLNQMEAILKMMEDTFSTSGNSDMRPNTISYVTAIDSFVRQKHENAAERAQATVDRMIKLYRLNQGHVKPTKIVLNTLIHAWSKSDKPNSAEKAEQIFKWMETQHRNGDELLRPDEITICAVLNAWANQAKTGGAKRAQKIWELTKSVSLEKRGFPLTINMPNIVINAIAKSGDLQAAQKAEAVLLSVESDFEEGRQTIQPDVATYSSVLNACAFQYRGSKEDKAESLDISLRTYRKSLSAHPNNVTFGTILKAIANLMPLGDKREVLVREIFDQCADAGLVDEFVLKQVRRGSPALYFDLIETPGHGDDSHEQEDIDAILNSVPTEWSSNVVG